MKYFAIESSLNEKLMGKIPQVKEFVHHCNTEEEPNFIDKFVFNRITTKPILSNIVLYANAKQTDFIDTYGQKGSLSGYLISDRLKLILDKFNCFGFQFFETYIIQKEQIYDNYWQTNIYDFPFKYIDFKKSDFILKSRDKDRNIISEIVSFDSMEEFNLFTNKLSYPKTISFKTVIFHKNMDLDFFSLKFSESYKGIVSERLKNEIEANKLIGIEFRPFEMPLQEWHHSSEREKKYDKF